MKKAIEENAAAEALQQARIAEAALAKAAEDTRLRQEEEAKVKAEEEVRTKLEEDARIQRAEAEKIMEKSPVSTVPDSSSSSQALALEQILERYQSSVQSKFEILESQNKALRERIDARDSQATETINTVATLQESISTIVAVIKKGEELRVKEQEEKRVKKIQKEEKKKKKKKKKKEEEVLKAKEAAERDLQILRLTELTIRLASKFSQNSPK